MDRTRLQQALIAADAAGDVEAAKALAQALRSVPVEEETYDPSAGRGFFRVGKWDTGLRTPQWLDRTLAGAGKAFYDVGRGVGQIGAQVADAFDPSQNLSGLVTGQDNSRSGRMQESIDEAKQLSAPLMSTTAGKVGNIAGGAAIAAPAAFIPGAQGLAGATLTGAGLGFVQPVATGESRTMNTAFGGAGGAAGYGISKAIGAVANRIGAPRPGVANSTSGGQSSATGAAQVTPGAANASASANGAVNLTQRSGINYGNVGPDPSAGLNGPTREILDIGREMGMRTTPGRASGSKALQALEAKAASQPMTMGRFAALDANNDRILGRVASRAIGEASDTLDDRTINNAFTRLGAAFEDAGDDVARRIDPDQFLGSLSRIESNYSGLLSGNKSVVETPLVRDAFDLASRGEATGQQLANLSSKLGKASRVQMTGQQGDRQLGMALGDVKDMVDDLLLQGMSGERASRLVQARGQYRTLLTLVNNQGVVDPTTGRVSGATLANVLQRGDRTGFTRGLNQSDLYNAARFSRAFKDSVGNSGTATRMPLNTAEMAVSVPFNLAARAYTSSPAINMVLRAQAGANAASRATAPVMNNLISPLLRPVAPITPYALPGAGGLFGTYATQQ